jgi:hypothetical protein
MLRRTEENGVVGGFQSARVGVGQDSAFIVDLQGGHSQLSSCKVSRTVAREGATDTAGPRPDSSETTEVSMATPTIADMGAHWARAASPMQGQRAPTPKSVNAARAWSRGVRAAAGSESRAKFKLAVNTRM